MPEVEQAKQITIQRGSEDWYKPGPSMQEFHRSRAETRVLVGGRGCGKTTGIAVEAIGHGWHNPGAKIYILRKTQDSNEGTTLETFEETFARSGSAYNDTGVSLFKKIDGGTVFRIPSLYALQLYQKWLTQNPRATKQAKLQWLAANDKYCSRILFAGVPHKGASASKFRGYECSLLIFVEADQLTLDDYKLGTACLRWKNAFGEIIPDTGCILDTNPPGPRHWIAELEEANEDVPFEEQESGKPATIRFWHIPTKENSHNLPPGYVERLESAYSTDPSGYSRMVMGQYAEAFDGDPVFHKFTMAHALEELPWPRGAYLVRGWDFGATNATVWSAYWEDGFDEYWFDLYEHFATQSDTDTQCQRVKEITDTAFPFWNDRDYCAGILDYCDPAGAAKTDKGRSLDVLATYNIYPGYRKLPLQPSIAVVNRMLQKRDRNGRLIYHISKSGCPMLYVGMMGGYRYPVSGEPGFGSGEPLKGEAGGNFDHICDAARYAKCNCMRLVKQMLIEKKKPHVGKLGQRRQYNRLKDW